MSQDLQHIFWTLSLHWGSYGVWGAPHLGKDHYLWRKVPGIESGWLWSNPAPVCSWNALIPFYISLMVEHHS